MVAVANILRQLARVPTLKKKMNEDIYNFNFKNIYMKFFVPWRAANIRIISAVLRQLTFSRVSVSTEMDETRSAK